MWRFIRQRDDYSCGPTAVLNAAKWAGLRYTYRDLDYLRTLCRTVPEHGTGDQDLENGLRQTLKPVATVQRGGRMTHLQAIRFLENPHHAMVLMYQWKTGQETEGHYIFAFGDGKRRIFLVNAHVGPPTVDCRYIRTFWRASMKPNKEHPPRIWLIRLRGG